MSDEFVGEIVGWFVAALVFVLFPVWRIHKRAGLNPGLSLLVLIPFVGILVSALVLVFSPWPRVSAPAQSTKSQGA